MNFNNVILAVILRILPTLIDNISPAVRQIIIQIIQDLEKKAKETKNPYDDMLIELLKAVFNVR